MFVVKLQYTTDCALLMMVCLTGENDIVSSRELEKAIRFPQQTIFNAGRRLKKAGLINKIRDGVKILGNGELTKKLTVQATCFSQSAQQKIEAAGGKAEVS